jgi:hypothetical protein
MRDGPRGVNRHGQSIRIEAGTRWDAVELLRALRGFDRHLVQLDRGHFELYVYVGEEQRTLDNDLRDRVRSWLDQRQLPQTTVKYADGTTVDVAAHAPS